MDPEVQADVALDNVHTKLKENNIETELDTNISDEPINKKPKLIEKEDENKVTKNTKLVQPKLNENDKKIESKEDTKLGKYDKESLGQKNKEPKILEEDDTDEEIEFDKDSVLRFINKNASTESSNIDLCEEFKEYIVSDLKEKWEQQKLMASNEKGKKKKNQATVNNKEVSCEKDCESDNEDFSMEHQVPELGFEYPLEQDASDMLDEVVLKEDGSFPSVTERYLKPYYAIDVKEPGDDICIYIHSNRVCMITLAPSHIIFQKQKTITNCCYKITEKLDRTKNKVSGKGKRGAQPMQKNSYLCRLTCDDGSVYMIRCCMNGKLIEVNEQLLKNPELLKKPPHFGGYIAIVLPNIWYHDEQLKNHLLDQKQYEEALDKRNKIQNEGPDNIENNDHKTNINQTENFGNTKLDVKGENKSEENSTIEEVQNKKELDAGTIEKN